MDELYNQSYYDNYLRHGGTTPYQDSATLRNSFQKIADYIIRDFAPRTLLDAGCAMGLLVEALRDRGVEAYGVDISNYAISQVREDVRPYCAVGSLTDPLPVNFPQHFDLVTTIEVLEHIYAPDGEASIANLCACTDRILFSSSPDSLDDPTHFNVQQREYWAVLFAKNGFSDEVFADVSAISPHALSFRRGIDDALLVEGYERAIRLMKTRLPKIDFIAKLYFDTGDGYHEAKSETIALNGNPTFSWSGPLPTGCKSVRFDPVEGCGCLVSDLKLLGPNGVLVPAQHNGVALGDSLLFSSRDPQIEITTQGDIPFDYLSITSTLTMLDTYALSQMVYHVNHIVEMRDVALAQVRQMQDQQEIQMNTLNQEHRAQAQQTQVQQEAQLNALRHEYQEQARQAQAQLDALLQEVETQMERLRSIEAARDELERRLEQEENTSTARWKEIQEYSKLVAYERGEAAKTAEALSSIQNSHIWRATKPLRLFLDGIKCCLRPFAKVLRSFRQNGLRITLQKIGGHLPGKPAIFPATVQLYGATTSSSLQERLAPITANPVDAIASVLVCEPVHRLNVVTDTIDAGSLLGGVATALIVATEYANHYGYELRIITRNTDVNPLNYENIMRISGVVPAKSVSYYSDYERHERAVDFKLELSEGDVFFATSWWSAQAIMKTSLRWRFFYIIQEVETFFYNYGDERMLCEQTMRSNRIDFIINSGYLFNYFKAEFPCIPESGMYFEPAFPKDLYRPGNFTPKHKYKLFFYARPHNPRNLFATGVSMLDEAIRRGILDTNVWTICCVGQDVPDIHFCDGTSTVNLGQMEWEAYAQFLADVDLGLCLMYTPHPSYPPYDVACSGGVVLSNRMCNKTVFPQCQNVILGDLELESFMDAFADAVVLAKDSQMREKYFEESTICRNWSTALEETVTGMGRCTGDV